MHNHCASWPWHAARCARDRDDVEPRDHVPRGPAAGGSAGFGRDPSCVSSLAGARPLSLHRGRRQLVLDRSARLELRAVGRENERPTGRDMAALRGRHAGEVEIAYLGLMPAFIGRRLGAPLLTAAIRRGWAMGAGRVWVHTCTLDSPYALAHYQARGMRVFKEQTEAVDLPSEPPGAWPGAGIHGPHPSLTPAKTN